MRGNHEAMVTCEGKMDGEKELAYTCETRKGPRATAQRLGLSACLSGESKTNAKRRGKVGYYNSLRLKRGAREWLLCLSSNSTVRRKSRQAKSKERNGGVDES